MEGMEGGKKEERKGKEGEMEEGKRRDARKERRKKGKTFVHRGAVPVTIALY